MISKYRVDFYRLARTMSEIAKESEMDQFLKDQMGPVLFEKINKHIPDGHILDTVQVIEKAGLSGKDIMDKHVLPHFKEAKLSSWDCVELEDEYDHQ